MTGVRGWSPGGELVLDNTVGASVEPEAVVYWLRLLYGTSQLATVARLLVVVDFPAGEGCRPPSSSPTGSA